MFIVIVIIVFCCFSKEYEKAKRHWRSIVGKLKKLENAKMSPSLALAKLGMTAAGILQWCDMGNIYDLLKDRREGLDR